MTFEVLSCPDPHGSRGSPPFAAAVPRAKLRAAVSVSRIALSFKHAMGAVWVNYVESSPTMSARCTGRYADGWFPVGILSPEQYADGFEQVQAAADNANRNPTSILAANAQFVVTGRSSAEVEEALNSVMIRAFALIVPGWAWAEHGAQHPLGEGFGGFQDILPQTFDEQSALAYAAAAPISLLKQYLLSGTPDEVIEQLAGWRDHGVRYPVLCNISAMQTKLSRGLAATLPFGADPSGNPQVVKHEANSART